MSKRKYVLPRKSERNPIVVFLVLLAVAIGAAALIRVAMLSWPALSGGTVIERNITPNDTSINTPLLSDAHASAEVIRVIDGDTFIVRFASGQRDTIRVEDIDTPETRSAKCTNEKELGKKATERAKALLDGTTVTLEGNRRDRFDRRLSKVFLPDGQNFGNVMLSDGQAVVWPNDMDWCEI